LLIKVVIDTLGGFSLLAFFLIKTKDPKLAGCASGLSNGKSTLINVVLWIQGLLA
jgi:hypothetical protein